MQLTLTACLAGMALGQLVVGPLSDRWGRRRPLLVGMVVYVLATAVCAFAPTAPLLIGFRLVQGLAGAAGIVIARAVVRDLYDGVAMARFFSTLMLISGVAPIVAPVIGGQILRLTDWRGVFAVCTVIGVLLTFVAWRWLHETLPPERPPQGRAGRDLRRDARPGRRPGLHRLRARRQLRASRRCSPTSPRRPSSSRTSTAPRRRPSACCSASTRSASSASASSTARCWSAGSPWTGCSASGLALITLASVALVALTSGVFGRAGLPEIAAALFVLMASMGLVLPTTNTQALLRTRKAAGSASALLGTSSFLIGAVLSPLAGVAGDGTALPMAVVQLTCVSVAVACFVGLCLRGRRTVEGR